MNISVILGHPDRESFNHAIARAVTETLEANSHTVFFHDLYEEKFDPLLCRDEIQRDCSLGPDLKRYCDEIATADGIVIIHPNWWGQPPAILKGWVDRVMRPGVAYRFVEGDSGEGVPVGLLRAKVAVVFNTANTPNVRERAVFDDPLETLWKNCVFDLCGVKEFYRKTFTIIVMSTPEQRQTWLDDVREVVSRYFPAKRRTEPACHA